MTACATGYDRVLSITLEGQRPCDSVTAEEFGAPRDCALLRGIGVPAGWDQVVDDIKQFDEHMVSRRTEDPWRNVET